ncbi:MAG: non-ribosomal peptide synthetase [Spirochaetaceae bacterium]|nr:non-ribosomal peptide synthetase [Spirochaetaceae bacterium]
MKKEWSVHDLILRIQRKLQSHFQNGTLSLGSIVENLRKNSSIKNQRTVVSSSFNYASSVTDFWSLSDGSVKCNEIPKRNSFFDYQINILEGIEEEVLHLTVRSEFLKNFKIDFFSSFINSVIDQVIDSQTSLIKDIGYFHKDNVEQLIKRKTDDTCKQWKERTILESIERSFLDYNLDIALKSDTLSMTYGQLNIATGKIASTLHTKNVDKKYPIAIYMDKSVEFIVVSLGILRYGCAYTPIPPSTPTERTQSIISVAGVRCIIDGNANRYIDSDNPSLCIINYEEILFSSGSVQEEFVVDESSLAYVLFTSGSTGIPKGVMGHHAGLNNRLRWMIDEFNINHKSIIIQKTPITFDVSIWELFLPLMVGAKIIVTTPDGQKDNDYLIDTIKREEIDVIHFVPTMLLNFLNHSRSEECKSIKSFICSGEALTPGIMEKFYRIFPEGNLINLYGPTEASIDVTCWYSNKNWKEDYVPIGKPISNTQIYILDDENHICPDGLVGEIAIGGVNVARGYINSEELTKKSFIAITESEDHFVYKTGDYGRYLSDGNIQFLGRKDSQIQLRGNRIELSEISMILEKYPFVKHSALKHWKISETDQFIAAYIIQKDKFEKEDIKTYLRRFLPEIMVPTYFVFLESFHLNNSGKLDIKALPNPRELKVNKVENARNISYSPDELKLKSYCEEVFKVKFTGKDQNFFDVGVHSLLLSELQIKIENEMGIKLSYLTFLKYPNIEELARYIKYGSDSNEKLSEFKKQIKRRRR